MRIHCFRNCFILGLMATVFVSTGHATAMPQEFDSGRNRLITYILTHQLPREHFAHKPFDEELSTAAYDLYLRQLDPRKRFLTVKDLEKLDKFANRIDDEFLEGRITLPDTGMKLLAQRVLEMQTLVDEIIDAGFDPNRKDFLETDPKKMEPPADKKELKDRWRRSIKLDVLETYLSEIKKQNKELEKEGKPALSIESGTVDKATWDIALTKVRKRTHQYLHRLEQVTRQEHYDRFYDAVARAYDPHTGYMAPTSKEDFDIHMSGSLEGIGALLREDDGHIKVVRIIPGSAAEQQGQLQAEDVIMAVSEKDGDPVDISDMRIRDAVSYIRGPKGTEVRLTVTRADGSRLVIAIVRDVVKLEESYAKSTLLKDTGDAKIGYIRIPSFYRDFSGGQPGEEPRNVTDDTRREIYKLKQKGITGLILDLRNNGGGALTDAVDVSGLFLPGGPVVQVKNSQGMIRVLEDEDRNISWDGPMIVLVNRFSASASEILAAALQDYGRALIIGGDHTYGKGVVQALLDMNRNVPLLHRKKYNNLGALKITIQKFYRVNGGSTQHKGVIPDIVLPSMLDYLETGEQYMDHSLPWDQVEDVEHKPWKGSRFDVSQARNRSNEYVAENIKFKKIEQESAKAEKRSKKTQVAGYLAGVVEERKEIERMKKEAKAAGILRDSDEDEDKKGTGKKSLDEEVANDPYIHLAIYLMDNISQAEHKIGKAK